MTAHIGKQMSLPKSGLCIVYCNQHFDFEAPTTFLCFLCLFHGFYRRCVCCLSNISTISNISPMNCIHSIHSVHSVFRSYIRGLFLSYFPRRISSSHRQLFYGNAHFHIAFDPSHIIIRSITQTSHCVLCLSILTRMKLESLISDIPEHIESSNYLFLSIILTFGNPTSGPEQHGS